MVTFCKIKCPKKKTNARYFVKFLHSKVFETVNKGSVVSCGIYGKCLITGDNITKYIIHFLKIELLLLLTNFHKN